MCPTIKSMDVIKVTVEGAPGLSYWQSRKLRRPTWGTRAASNKPVWAEDVTALSLVLREGAALSHTTAANLLKLPLPQVDPRPLHVTVPLGTARGSRDGVVWHTCDLTGLRMRIHGMTLTGPWKTWIDLGSLLGLADLVAVTDVLLRRGYLTRDELVVPQGVRGARLLRRAAVLADGRSASARESQLRVHFLEAGLPVPDVNADIFIDGGWIAQGDLVWWEFKVVLEYDGEDHKDEGQRHQDAIIRKALRDDGWVVIELTNRHYQRLTLTIEEVKTDLMRCGWKP